MARYTRRRRRIYRGRRKWRRWKKRNLINATSRSRCTIKSRATWSNALIVPQAENFSSVMCINPFVVRGPVSGSTIGADRFYPFSTVDQPLVKNFCNLYDEIKVDGVVLKITVTSPVPGGGGFDALRVWTAWDRKGAYSDTFYSGKTPTPAELSTLPSCNVVMLSNNTINTFYRYCKASDFFEKYCFLDATQTHANLIVNNISVPNSQYVEAWLSATGAISCFSPTFMLCIETVNFSPTANLSVNIAFEMTTYYTFRNPKYGGSSQNAQTKQQKTVEVGTSAGGIGVAVPVEDVIMDPESVGVTVGGKKRGVDATVLGMTDEEAADLYAISDPKKYDDTAPAAAPPPQRSRRVVLPSTDADLVLPPYPPPAARAAAETAGIHPRVVYPDGPKN